MKVISSLAIIALLNVAKIIVPATAEGLRSGTPLGLDPGLVNEEQQVHQLQRPNNRKEEHQDNASTDGNDRDLEKSHEYGQWCFKNEDCCSNVCDFSLVLVELCYE